MTGSSLLRIIALSSIIYFIYPSNLIANAGTVNNEQPVVALFTRPNLGLCMPKLVSELTFPKST